MKQISHRTEGLLEDVDEFDQLKKKLAVSDTGKTYSDGVNDYYNILDKNTIGVNWQLTFPNKQRRQNRFRFIDGRIGSLGGF